MGPSSNPVWDSNRTYAWLQEVAALKEMAARALWWDPRRDSGNTSWGSHVVLSERFYREATEAPVPLDLRVLRALRSRARG
jgi:hypothetical protein